MEQLALDFGVEDVSLLQQWIQGYEQMGSEGLVSERERQRELKSARGHQNVYSITFKKNVVNLYLSSSMSYAEVAKPFNLKNSRLISDWVKQAVEGRLIDKKLGRPQKQEMMLRKTIQDEDKDKQIKKAPPDTIGIRLFKSATELGNCQRNKEKTAIIFRLREKYPLKSLLKFSGLAKSTYFYWFNRLNKPHKD